MPQQITLEKTKKPIERPKWVIYVIIGLGAFALLAVLLGLMSRSKNSESDSPSNSSSSNSRNERPKTRPVEVSDGPNIIVSECVALRDTTKIPITEETFLDHDYPYATATNIGDMYVDGTLVHSGDNWPGGLKRNRVLRPVNNNRPILKIIKTN